MPGAGAPGSVDENSGPSASRGADEGPEMPPVSLEPTAQLKSASGNDLATGCAGGHHG